MSASPAKKKSRGEEALARFHEEGRLTAYDAKHLAQLWPYIPPHRAYFMGSIRALALCVRARARSALVMSRAWTRRNEPGARSPGIA